MCSNVPCGGAFGQKGRGFPCIWPAWTTRSLPHRCPVRSRGSQPVSQRHGIHPLLTLRAPPPWHTGLVLFLATITSAVRMGHDNTSVIEWPPQICDSPLSSFLAASARAAEMTVCPEAATTWDVFSDATWDVLTTLDKKTTLDTTWDKWNRRTALGREDSVRPSLAPRSPPGPCFRSAPLCCHPMWDSTDPGVAGGSLCGILEQGKCFRV